ncbi:hypothetical protein AUC70_11760 [Methyloceanibacter stevinii]|uniref:Mu-like prophage I protein n=1 Tax=Methyloceanibacter stevinii TaxID=1774970 RepID=A0A1E3VJ49_9HYPH|nr:phage protease [Methyloceanibacter stevinii]ODR93533.1 hypothetical protein AUC70_11760 [Methyloceanibacter stevinii]
MTKPNATLAAFSIDLGLAKGADVPDYIKLIPLGELQTVDSRGPYRVNEPEKIIAASMQSGDRWPIDENHATDRAAVTHEPAPARGWIVEMQTRADGIWGKVEWTKAGRELMADRAYRFLSPVITHDEKLNVLTIERAALTNTPNLRGMVALNMEGSDMDFMGKLRKALGLAEDADEDAVLAAVAKATEKVDVTKAVQSALNPIGKAAGLGEGATGTAILGRVETLNENAKEAGSKDEAVTALQTELKDTATKLTELQTGIAKSKAEAFVDGCIKEGRVGVKAVRDHYIARHMKEPEAVEKELTALPVLDGGAIIPTLPGDKDGVALQSAEQDVCVALGIPEDKFKETRDAERSA